MNKKQLKEELKKIEDREAEGYLIFDDCIREIAYCSASEIIYHFKKKEELRMRINEVKKNE